MTRRTEMLALVKQAHAAQSRNNGRVPYWMHVQSVAQILEWAIEQGGETDAPVIEDLYLAAMGHDLFEDTQVTRADIATRFGERVADWIQGMTNDGDADRAAYLVRMAAAPEEVRLIKYADVVENTTCCSYAIPDMGVEWTQTFFLPIATEMRDLLGASMFSRYPRTAAVLRLQLELQHRRLRDNVAMFAPDPPPPKRRGGPPPRPFTKEEWAEAVRQQEEEEKKRTREIFGDGPIFPIPTPESDS